MTNFEIISSANTYYDALSSQGRRRQVTTTTKSPDAMLNGPRRKQLISSTRDIHRNFELASWVVRQHVNYVASFKWQATTDDHELNELLEWFVYTASKPDNFDVAGRFSLEAFLRVIESSRVVDGDFWVLKHNDGKVQGIESDRVVLPAANSSTDPFRGREFVNGVEISVKGKPKSIVVCERDIHGNFINPRALSFNFLWQIGYFDRVDQVRGISPLACALNRFRDTYESIEYAINRAKLEQYFGLVIKRDADAGFQDPDNPTKQIDFGSGPLFLDLDPGEDADFLESKAPGSNFASLQQFVIMMTLKALDVPYSFFDESHTNFSASRSAVIQYIKSVEHRREELRHFLESWTMWRIATGIRDGVIPPNSFDLIELAGEWRPVNVPWWDVSKEIDGNLRAISAGLDNPQRVSQHLTGTDYFENLRLRKQAEDAADELGLTVSWSARNQKPIIAGEDDEVDETEEETDEQE